MKAILDKEVVKNRKLLKEKELLEEKVESVNQIKQESTDIQVRRIIKRKSKISLTFDFDFSVKLKGGE